MKIARLHIVFFALLIVLGFSSCDALFAPKGNSGTTTGNTKANFTERGIASYYADKYEGKPTASGEPFRQKLLTGAHRTLPFGTIVTVTNLKNGKSIKVRINDRGPFKAGRIIDVTRKAAEELGFVRDGLVDVKIEANL